jgi:hypothetical protein
MKLGAALLLGVAIFGASTPSSRMSRSSLRTVEKQLETALLQAVREEPFELLSAAQSVHLPGYGMVFTTELDLLAFARPNPFGRPEPTGGALEQLREKKRLRIGFLKERMRLILIQSADQLPKLDADESIALAVSIPHYTFLAAKDLPQQIVMYGKKRDLQAISKDASLPGLHTEELF